jgi:hypothetical protein
VGGLRRQRGVLEQMALLMRNAGICKAYATWAENAAEAMRLKRKAKMVVQRLRNACVVMAFYDWRACVEDGQELSTKAETATKALQRLLNRAAFEALDRWRCHTAQEKQRKVKLLRAVQKMLNRAQAGTFGQWLATAREQAMERGAEERKQVLIQKVMKRMQHRGLSAALSRWHGNMHELRAIAGKTSKVIAKWAKKSMAVLFAQWHTRKGRLFVLRSRLSVVIMKMMGTCLRTALCCWQHVVYWARALCRMASVRRGQLLEWALYSWAAYVCTERALLGRESRVLFKRFLSARQSLFRRWEEQALRQRTRAVSLNRACSVERRALSKASLNAWKGVWTSEKRALQLRHRLVCLWAVTSMRPVVRAWNHVAARSILLRERNRKLRSSSRRLVLKKKLAQWLQAALGSSCLRRCAQRLLRRVSALTLCAILVAWHRGAAMNTCQRRLRARILLSQPRLSSLRRADESWRRALLFDWLRASKAARGRARLEQALATRSLWSRLQPILYVWHFHSVLSRRVLELSRKVLMRSSCQVCASILTAWRVAAVELLSSRHTCIIALSRFQCGPGKQHLKRLCLAAWRLASRNTRAVTCVANVHVRGHRQRGMHLSLRAWSFAKCHLLDTRRRASDALSRRLARTCKGIVWKWAMSHRHSRRLRHAQHLCCQARRARLASLVSSSWHARARFKALSTRAFVLLSLRLNASAIKKAFAVWLPPWRRSASRRLHAAAVASARFFSCPLFPSRPVPLCLSPWCCRVCTARTRSVLPCPCSAIAHLTSAPLNLSILDLKHINNPAFTQDGVMNDV